MKMKAAVRSVSLVAAAMLLASCTSSSSTDNSADGPDPSTIVQRQPQNATGEYASSPPGMTSRWEPNPELQSDLMRQYAGAYWRYVFMYVKVVTDRGEPALNLAGAPVFAYAEPARHLTASAPAGQGFALTRIAGGEIDKYGNLELRTPWMTDIGNVLDRDYLDRHDGSLSVLIMGGNKEATIYRRLQVKLPKSPYDKWALATADDLITETPVARSVERTEDCLATDGPDVKSPLDVPCDNRDGIHLPPLTIQLPAYPTNLNVGVDGSRYCENQSYFWSRSDANVINRDVDILRTRTGRSASVSYSWSSAGRTETDSAANLGKNGSLVQGGYTKTQSVEAGVTWTLPRDGGIKAFRAPYEYRAFHLYCYNNGTSEITYSGVYEWRPYRYRGGAVITDSETFACPMANRVPLSAGSSFWVARATTSQVSGGVGFGNISLRRSQTNSEDHRLTFKGEVGTAQICGKDNQPAEARQVKED